MGRGAHDKTPAQGQRERGGPRGGGSCSAQGPAGPGGSHLLTAPGRGPRAKKTQAPNRCSCFSCWHPRCSEGAPCSGSRALKGGGSCFQPQKDHLPLPLFWAASVSATLSPVVFPQCQGSP